MTGNDPARDFAVQVVSRLKAAGFQALWAGGCVRDALRGQQPKDYDVASTATPDEVIRLFGTRSTFAVGASFGVVVVLGPSKAAGQIEVATFRSDGEYLDGRRPSEVRFCSPEQDALRRDFTINGMFFDPLEERVIDYVGGQQDLQDRILRAIGVPEHRFREDKLRMLRAVRFAATLDFRLDPATADAIRSYCHDLMQVSAERIAQELRRMLADSSRAAAFNLLAETDLLPVVFPELYSTLAQDTPSTNSEQAADPSSQSRILASLQQKRFEPALAALLLPLLNPGSQPKVRIAALRKVCLRLKLSNDETGCVTWLTDSLSLISEIAARPLHVLKPLLADARSAMLLDLSQAVAAASGSAATDAKYCREYLSRTPSAVLTPAPLVNGSDLNALNVAEGPRYRELLDQVRQEQLDELLDSREAALLRLKQLIQE